jgi:hypothetical protein
VLPAAADAKGRDAHRFNINVVGRVYQLKANSEVEANRWLEGLTFALDRRKVTDLALVTYGLRSVF